MKGIPIQINLDSQYKAALERLAHLEEVSYDDVLMAAYRVYLWKCGGTDYQDVPVPECRFNQYLQEIKRKRQAKKLKDIVAYHNNGVEALDESQPQSMHRSIRRIITQVLTEPELEIARIEIITREEKRKILGEFNNTTAIYPWKKTVTTEFEEQVERQPMVTAVIKVQCHVPFEQESLTYGELNKSANRMARGLRQEGVQRGDIVAIMLTRTMEMTVAQWAVLKAGATYMTIDHMYPWEKLKKLLEQTGSRYVITGTLSEENPIVDRIGSCKEIRLLNHLCLTEQSKVLPGDNLEQMSEPDDLMYIAITETPTGVPKGAGVYHRGIQNLAYWFITEFRLRAGDRNLLMTTPGGVITQKNFYVSLVSGGTLCIPAFQHFEPAALLREIRDNTVTWINCTPRMLYQLVAYDALLKRKKMASLRYVFLEGDSIDIKKLMSWYESDDCNAQIVNTYSIAECSDVCAAHRIFEPGQYLQQAVPVGRPVNNVQMYVMDDNGNQQPLGVSGELYISGECLGGGYIGDEELTLKKFVKRALEEEKGQEELFRTGDKGVRLPDGTIEFIGPMDRQSVQENTAIGRSKTGEMKNSEAYGE
jgi:amino acid adenylation domain-containing protein